MKNIIFSWNNNKSIVNKNKHGVSFEEAKTVFYDEYASIIPDPEHSAQEARFILLGMSVKLRIIVVCHCYRQQDNEIRIISARKATKKEISQYNR